MPESLNRELLEVTAQVRGLLQDLQNLGFDEVPLAPPTAGLPRCRRAAQTDGEVPGVSCRSESLEEIRAELENSSCCALCRGRSHLVFGVGDPRARLVLVGEAPGREEDETGEPFVGEAGRLLDRILLAMGLSRKEVYLCNVLKCHPPGNRDPHHEELAACEPFLKRQLAAIAPEVIVTLGKFAAQALLQDPSAVGELRGRWHQYTSIPVMPTYHPAYLLRNPASKRDVWEDMKEVMQRLRGGGNTR
jgi:DNA polymerase